MIVLHITTRAAWEQAQGAYEAPSLATEGFIHLSRPEQVVKVANARYSGQSDLVLLCIDPDRLEAQLKVEPGDDTDELFPHLYGALNVDAVFDVLPFPEGPEGFELPQLASGT